MDINSEYGEQLALKVLSSGETSILEVGKNETSPKLEQSAFTKSDNDLQIQLERSKKAMSLLRKIDEQSKILKDEVLEIKFFKN